MIHLDQNKHIFVCKHTQTYFWFNCSLFYGLDSVKNQLVEMKVGVNHLIPHEYMKAFTATEFEVIVCGLPEINLDNLMERTKYKEYSASSQVVVWLWEILMEASQVPWAICLVCT